MAAEIVEPGATATATLPDPKADAEKAAEQKLQTAMDAATAEAAAEEAASLEAEDNAAAGVAPTSSESEAELTKPQKAAVAAAVKLAELQGGLQLDDGTVIPADDVRGYMKDIGNQKALWTSLHQRGEDLNKQEARIQYGMTVQRMAATDPRFDQGVQALERNLYGGGSGQAAPTAGQASATDEDLTVKPPEGYEDDLLAKNLAQQMTEKLGRALTKAERMATQVVEQRLQRIRPMEEFVGRLAGEKVSEHVRKGLSSLKIPSTPEMMNEISRTAAELGVDEYNPSARTDAFRIVTHPHLLKRLTGSTNGSEIPETTKAPTTVPLHAGSGVPAKSASERLTPDELTGYRLWRDAHVDDKPTVSKWRARVAKDSRG